MDLKTKADRDYLIHVYNLAKPGTRFDSKLVTRTPTERKSFDRLRMHGYIVLESFQPWKLTSAGLKAAKEAEELRDQEAEEAASKASERKSVSRKELFNTLSPWIQFALQQILSIFCKR